jgi:hypothetical protein
MPDTPGPITPEGKRAAERVHTIFSIIIAANLVVVALIGWKVWAARRKPPPPGSEAPETTETSQ